MEINYNDNALLMVALERFMYRLYSNDDAENNPMTNISNWIFIDKFKCNIKFEFANSADTICGYIYNQPIKYNGEIWYYCIVRYLKENETDVDILDSIESFKSYDEQEFRSMILSDDGVAFKEKWIVNGKLPYKCSNILERGA